jgi:predicted acetyltransferase
MKTSKFQIKLHAAIKDNELKCIENMMQLYNYDFSEWYPLKIKSNGFFAINSRTDYWMQPNVRSFIIFANEEIAGFAVIDDEVINADTNFNMGYFL